MVNKQNKIAIFDIDGTIFRKNLQFELINEMSWMNIFPRKVRDQIVELYVNWLEHKGTYEQYRAGLVELYEKYINGCNVKDVRHASKIVVSFHQNRTYVFAEELIRKLRHENYHMIAISFEEGEELAAQEAFINDLKVLQEKNLVLAYLAKPQLMKLVDEVGTGKNYYTLFCMVFVDTPKIEKELGQTNFSNNTLILNKIGCKLESGEILTNWLGNRSPARKYHVEEVRIGVKQYDELKNSMVESYSAQQEHLQSKAQEFVKKKASFWNDYTHSEPNPSGS